MLDNREMVTAKGVFPVIANIWQLRRLDHICPPNPSTEGPEVSERKIHRVVVVLGGVWLPFPETPCASRFMTLRLGRETRCGVKCKRPRVR